MEYNLLHLLNHNDKDHIVKAKDHVAETKNHVGKGKNHIVEA